MTDTGSGIDDDIIERIFDPFFTTKPTGKGTGMGLSVVYGVCQMHNANIQVESGIGAGTVFRLFFPAEIGADTETVAEEEYLRTGTERILFVDDEPQLTGIAEELLRSLGYTVTTSNSSTEALALLNEKPDEFDLLITDQTMPELQGIDLARHALQINPRLPVILCSGYSSTVNEVVAEAAGIRCFLMKPLTKKELCHALGEALDTSR